jgi:leader peptidase (prepilin peptidase)/N-methyltransferase
VSDIIELFIAYQSFFLASVFVLGLMVGSFLNVVILRFPVMMERDWKEQCCELLELDDPNLEKNKSKFNLFIPRSHCQKCKHQILAIENIPVISYLFLKGKCRNCKTNVSVRYPLVEIASGVSAVIVAYYFGVSTQALFGLILTWSLIALSMIDFDTQYLPDDIVLPLLWLGIIVNIFGEFIDLKSSVLGAIIGYGTFWSVNIMYKLATGKEGMGHGDFKLLAMLGAWLGWKLLPLIIILSSCVGAIIGISLIVFKSYNRNTNIPFGPYLATAGWISMLWGSYIMSAYYNAVI